MVRDALAVEAVLSFDELEGDNTEVQDLHFWLSTQTFCMCLSFYIFMSFIQDN